MGVAQVHQAVDFAFHFTAMAMNVGLFILVQRYSQQRVKEYKKVMQVACFCDFLVSLTSFVGQPVSGSKIHEPLDVTPFK